MNLMPRLHLILATALLFTSAAAFAQSSPKREFRAAWIATVSNIDWPSKPGLPAVQQQLEFTRRLDQLRAMGCNAVIVQVRPAADALYESAYEPWSRFLTGRQGQGPFPHYDPLRFMVEEAHKRNMEFHAWFNPFRALTDSKKNPNPPSHVTRQHPDWIVSYGGKSYINPGIPEAREYVVKVICDVVRRYDIDAVHLDDYFYPYRIAGQEFPDQQCYSRYGGSFNDKADWRRNNVSLFVSVLNTNIKQIKPWMKLGISPFGVWRNASQDPRGSRTRGGQTCYDDLYADVLEWTEKGWIDYLLPQLYWEHQHRAAAFEVLLPWWQQYRYNRHIYYGLGIYRMAGVPQGVWAGTSELARQISDIRKLNSPTGFVFYSASSFDKANPVVRDSVESWNHCVAFPPTMKWIDSLAPAAPALKAIPSAEGTLLRWTPGPGHQNEPLRYAVYRFTGDEPLNLERADKIISLSSGTEFLDRNANRYGQCSYVVTALDRLWNESAPSNAAQVRKQ